MLQGVWFVRWGTEYEDDDISDLLFGSGRRLGEDFARALNALGWAIVHKEGPPEEDPTLKWPMDSEHGPVPEWADDVSKSTRSETCDDPQAAHET